MQPNVPYSRAKGSLGQWLEDVSPALEVTSAWLRIFYPYGPGEHSSRLPSLLMRKLSAGVSTELRTPDSIKDYIFLDDLAACVAAVLESSLTGPVNVGSGMGVRIWDLALAAAAVLKVDAALLTRAHPVASDPWPVHIADPSRLHQIGWAPTTSLKTGLAKLAESLSSL